MGKRVVLLAAALVLIALALRYGLGGAGPPAPDPGGGGHAVPATSTGAGDAAPQPRGDRTPGAPAEAALRLFFRNAENGAPLADVEVRQQGGTEVLARSDSAGHALVAGRQLQELAFRAAGHLETCVSMLDPGFAAATRAAAGTSVEVRLWPDRYTLPFRMRFEDPGAQPARAVEFRIVSLDEPPPQGGVPRERAMLRGALPAGLRDAWERHVRLITAPGASADPHHLGAASDATLFRAGGEVVVRFSQTGRYRVVARDERGALGRAEFFVPLNQESPLLLRLQAPLVLAGRIVRAADGEPVAEAQVAVADGPFGASETRAGADGTFALDGLDAAPVRVRVEHPRFVSRVLENVRPGQEPVEIRLTARPRVRLAGVVRLRPGLTPVADARVAVSLHEDDTTPVETRTDAHGRFAAELPGGEVRVRILATGCMPYFESVDTAGAPSAYDLLPADPEARVRAGLVALASGRVLGPDGSPRAGVPVRVLAEGPVQVPGGIAGRRILEGGTVAANQVALSGADGSFLVEHPAEGPVRVVAVDGSNQPEDGVAIVATLGRTHRDLVLRTRR
ncbi:MAG: carboxypeptidase regulatory-like domain-containing protein [Planctomycetes bacterium]|nr:carboxypeptidase regulatory-like domain-containing protein [Planctomycetota bacterium]